MEIKQVQLINFINKLVWRKVLGWGLKLFSSFPEFTEFSTFGTSPYEW